MTLTLTQRLEIKGPVSRRRSQRLVEGDFERLVSEYHPRIFRLFLGWFRDPEQAENLTQECFLRAYRRRGSFRGQARVGTWLTRIAINLAHDQRRSRRLAFWRSLRGIEGTETPDRAPSPDRALEARERMQRVHRLIAALPPRQRTVFQLRFFEEMPLAEIAELLELSVGTVKSHLSRAVGAVRRGLEKEAPCRLP